MIKMVFCDDDLSVLNQLSILIDKYRIERRVDIEYAAFNSSLELLSEFEKGMQADVLFLDVLMPCENGIEVAKEIREYDNNMKIIFLTSSSEYAVQSYTVNAYFYQMKPIWEESFFRLMDSVITECQKVGQFDIVLKCKNGITRIKLDKLKYVEVMGRTLLLYMENGQVHERAGSLEELQEQLNGYQMFLRPHRSYLVNMEYILNVTSKNIIMEDTLEIPIPHGKYSVVKDQYLEYIFHRKKVFLE